MRISHSSQKPQIMAKMEKLGFGPTLALCHGRNFRRKDPWRGCETFCGLSAPCVHDKQCHVTYGDMGWRLHFSKIRIGLPSMAKMKKLGFGPSLAQYHGQKDPWSDHETF